MKSVVTIAARLMFSAMLACLPALSGDVWIVLYSTQEKCFDCPYRTLIATIPSYTGGEDPNIPLKPTTRTEVFGSKAQALDFMNLKSDTFIPGTARLYRAEAIALVEIAETISEPPPPPKTTVHRRFEEVKSK